MMLALSERFGRWLSGLALFGCLLLLAMMLIIVALSMFLNSLNSEKDSTRAVLSMLIGFYVRCYFKM